MGTWAVAAVAAVSTVMLGWCVVEIARGIASESWPHAAGTLLYSDVKESGGEVSLYRPGAIYSYAVEGTEYCGDRFQFGQFFLTAGSERWAEKQRCGLTVGSTVDVYYHPAKASVSTLRPGVAWRAYLWAGIMAGMAMLALRQLARGSS